MEVLVKTLYQRGRTFHIIACYKKISDWDEDKAPVYYVIHEENEWCAWELIEGIKLSDLPPDKEIAESYDFGKKFPLIILN